MAAQILYSWSLASLGCWRMHFRHYALLKVDCTWYSTLAKKNKTATTIMHKIRTLFLSRNITRLARWRNLPRPRASLHRSTIKLDFLISHDRNSVLILCIIVLAVFLASGVVLVCFFASVCAPAGVYVYVCVCTCMRACVPYGKM